MIVRAPQHAGNVWRGQSYESDRAAIGGGDSREQSCQREQLQSQAAGSGSQVECVDFPQEQGIE